MIANYLAISAMFFVLSLGSIYATYGKRVFSMNGLRAFIINICISLLWILPLSIFIWSKMPHVIGSMTFDKDRKKIQIGGLQVDIEDLDETRDAKMIESLRAVSRLNKKNR